MSDNRPVLSDAQFSHLLVVLVKLQQENKVKDLGTTYPVTHEFLFTWVEAKRQLAV